MNTQTEKTPSKIAEITLLKEARKRLGKTQQQVAAEVGIKSYQMIWQIESGQCPIPMDKVASFAKAYGVPAKQLGKLWVKKLSLKPQFKTDGNMDVLPIIKAVAECDIPQLTLNEFSRLLESVSRFQKCTPVLIREILSYGFK